MLIGKGDQILLCFLKTRRSFISWLYMVGWVKCVYNWLQVSLQNMHLTRLHTLSLPRSRTRAQKLTISPNGINKKWRLHAESHCADFLHVNDFHGLSGRSVTTLASPRSSNAAHFFGPLQLWYLITPTDLKPMLPSEFVSCEKQDLQEYLLSPMHELTYLSMSPNKIHQGKFTYSVV